MNTNIKLHVLSLCFLASACVTPEGQQTAVSGLSKPPNFLILIGDDMGVETLSCYGVGTSAATTPTLDNLCQSGKRFDNFWAQPVCSPTRATLLTGQYGFRTGVGSPASGADLQFPVPEPEVDVEEISGNAGRAGNRRQGRGAGNRNEPTSRPSVHSDAYGLPAALTADTRLGYQTAALGKWHLANNENGGLQHPHRIGFDHYAGPFNEGGVESFFAWSKVVNGEITAGQTGYVTTDTVDDAIEWLDGRDPGKPWLVWVAFNAAHSPWGPPPAKLLSPETAAAMENADDHTLFRAMIEAMDTEIGRLLSEIPDDELDNTYVVFIGDNGSPGRMASAPYLRGRVKSSLYQGGVNVPFIVTGPNIDPGTATPALANSVDVFATVLDLAGTREDEKLRNIVVDGVSLAPVLQASQASVRDFAYADVFGSLRTGATDLRTIRDDRFKIIRNRLTGSDEFYDLANDPYESTDLKAQGLNDEEQRRYDTLTKKLNELTADRS